MPPPKRVFDYAFTISDQHMNVRERDTSHVPFFALPQVCSASHLLLLR
jgi:hypothetical protein